MTSISWLFQWQLNLHMSFGRADHSNHSMLVHNSSLKGKILRHGASFVCCEWSEELKLAKNKSYLTKFNK
jgi:hypothetical protein